MAPIFLDVDGTLITSDFRVTERTRKALLAAKEKGHVIAICSGRAVRGLDTVIEELGFTPVLATLNGAYITDENGKLIFETAFSEETAIDMADRIEGLGLTYMYFASEDWGTASDGELYQYELSIVRSAGIKMDIRSFVKTRKVHKMLAWGPAETNLRLQDLLKEAYPDYEILSSSHTYTEINTPGTDKGLAIREVCRHLGTSTEEAICFGDFNNDIPAFMTAGCPVAMGNAIDEIKRLSRYVTASNDEDGIAKWIEEHLL